MATSADAVVDRVRAVCLAAGLVEAKGPDFVLAPTTAVSGQFAVRYVGAVPIGGFDFTEEARGECELVVARLTNQDYDATRRALLIELGDLVAGIVRDGATDGEFAVGDTGRLVDVEAAKGSAIVVGRARLSVNFEVQL